MKAGWYNIKSKLGTSFSLFVKGLSTKSGATIQLKKTTNSVGAAFLLKKEGERYRIYVGIGSGKYVEIKGSKAGAAVRTTAKKGSSSLYSLEYDAKLGGYRIVGSSGLALTVKSGKATDGGKITGEKENADSLAQVFVLSSRPGLLATTVYSVKSVQKGSRSLSASGSSAKFHKYNKAATQKWYVAPVDGKTNVYTIESIATGKVLVGAKNKAVKLAKADASNSATWWVPTYKSGGIVWKNYKTGKPLSTAGKKCAEGSSAMNKKQKTAKASVFKMSGASVLESGIYELHSAANSGYVVSVEGSSKNAGASVQMQSSTGANAQKWVYNASSYTFSNANSGLMLQAGTDTKATITQAKANSSTAQQWTVKYAGGGKYQLVSRANSRLALTATASQGSSAATSTNTGATTQKWGIVATSITVTPTGFNLIKSIVNNGHGSLDADYIVIHETANPGATAKNHRDLWAGNGYYADYAVHYVVDWTKNCYYCVPEDRLCWQVGNGNSHVIGIELCHATTKANFNKVWDAGVQWATWQLKKHGWGIDRLLSHNECRKIWGGTDHTDPDGYFKTYGKTWSQFKAAVAKELAK